MKSVSHKAYSCLVINLSLVIATLSACSTMEDTSTSNAVESNLQAPFSSNGVSLKQALKISNPKNIRFMVIDHYNKKEWSVGPGDKDFAKMVMYFNPEQSIVELPQWEKADGRGVPAYMIQVFANKSTLLGTLYVDDTPNPSSGLAWVKITDANKLSLEQGLKVNLCELDQIFKTARASCQEQGYKNPEPRPFVPGKCPVIVDNNITSIPITPEAQCCNDRGPVVCKLSLPA